MNCDICQYRASVGGFYSTMLSISTFRLNFVTTYTIMPFLSLVYLKIRGMPIAIFFMFVLNHLNENDKNETYCNIDAMTCDKSTRVYTDLMIASLSDLIILSLIVCILIMTCNDVHPNPGPPTNPPSLSIVHNNIKSIRHKLDYVYAELNRFDIITISETWLKSSDLQDQILLPGYNEPIRRDRPNDSGKGGVAIYVKNNLLCKPRPDLSVQDLEAVWCETRFNQDIILVGCFYRAVYNVEYWDLIEESISKANNTPHKFIVIGDFNADCTVRPPPHLRRIMAMNNLYQLVSNPTRYENGSSTTIDLILTPCPDIISKVGVLPEIHSDHCAPYLEIISKNSSIHHVTFKRKLYNYSKINENKYIDILKRTDWNELLTTLSLNEAAEKFSDNIMYAVNECVPSKIICIKENDEPWFTNDIRLLSNKKLRIHTLAKRLNSTWCWNLFKRLRNQLTDKIRNRKQEYLLELENKVNDKTCFGSKEWWKLVNRFSAKKGNTQSDIPPLLYNDTVFYSPQEKAQIFNQYFINQSKIQGPDDTVPDVPVCDNVIEEIVITKQLVSKIIKNIDMNKSTGPGEVQNKMLLKGVDVLSEPLACLFNRSMNEGIFPKI